MVPQLTAVSQPRPDVFEVLAHSERRTVLDILIRHSSVGAEELASYVVAAETGTRPMDITPGEAEDALLNLRHVHLPKLEAANLTTRTDGHIALTRQPALPTSELERIVRMDVDDWDEVLACLADRCRQIVLSTLHDRDRPMDRGALAGAVARRLATGPGDGKTIDEDDVLLQLLHVHLPMLDSTGLVDYDPATEMVRYVGHPDLDENWL